MELQHLKRVFIKINNFPLAVVKRIIKHVGCEAFYIGESGRRLEERFKDHNGRDIKHTKESGHNPIVMDNVKIINKNFTNYYKRMVSEAIFIKKKKPPLNVQDMSVPLKLFS